MFISNKLSNILYAYQSWKNLGTIGVSSRTEAISAIYKKVIKKIQQTTDPSHSSLEAIIFLFLNISNIILHNVHFRNLKTNQLLSTKELYQHTLSTVVQYNSIILTQFMSKRLNEPFAVISLDPFSQGELGFYFLCPSRLVTDTN